MNKKKKFILPMAIASFCVEQISADSISGNDKLLKDVNAGLNNTIVMEPNNLNDSYDKTTKKADNSSSESLYNRNITKLQNGNNVKVDKKLTLKDKFEPSATQRSSARPLKIVTKVKDIKISNKHNTKKVSKNRVVTLKNYKKVANKAKLLNRLSKSKKRFNRLNYYIAKKGDSLRLISKKVGIPLVELVKINKLYKTSHIKIGQKIYFDKSSQFKSVSKKRRSKPSKKYSGKRELKVTATAYTSHAGQTDSTPFLAAWNNRIRPGMKIIAVSPDLIRKYKLTNGVKVRIKGLKGLFTIRDKMNKRFKKRIDIYMGTNRHKALQWGKKKITLVW